MAGALGEGQPGSAALIMKGEHLPEYATLPAAEDLSGISARTDPVRASELVRAALGESE